MRDKAPDVSGEAFGLKEMNKDTCDEIIAIYKMIENLSKEVIILQANVRKLIEIEKNKNFELLKKRLKND